jgi:5-methylcytosine-specific restriction endonuclease McrA
MERKACAKCGGEKRRRGEGKGWRCDACERKRCAAWRRENPEKQRACNKAWRAANGEVVKEKMRRYRELNREVLLEKGRERARRYRREHGEEINARNRSWIARNAEARRRAQARYREENREKVAAGKKRAVAANRQATYARNRRWAKAHPERMREYQRVRRARKLGANGVAIVGQGKVDQRMRVWGGKCWICGGGAEEMDHVKPLAIGGLHMASNLRPVCRRCNSKKGARWEGAVSGVSAAIAAVQQALGGG